MHMGILFNVFMRTLGFFLAILLGVLIIIGISAYTNYQEEIEFDLVKGNKLIIDKGKKEFISFI